MLWSRCIITLFPPPPRHCFILWPNILWTFWSMTWYPVIIFLSSFCYLSRKPYTLLLYTLSFMAALEKEYTVVKRTRTSRSESCESKSWNQSKLVVWSCPITQLLWVRVPLSLKTFTVNMQIKWGNKCLDCTIYMGKDWLPRKLLLGFLT